MLPHLHRAVELGFAAHPALRIGDRAYAMTARALPDERAVLVVARDRTEEMRRELAEADFISNAAHELRNPLAGISSAIEVLQEGAKDDPKALDHFLGRLAEDAERMNRLTRSLLTLARVESVGAGETEIVDVPAAIRDVVAGGRGAAATSSCCVEIEPDLAAEGDPTLLRQVMVGLLTNAFKNTPPPGTVTVRGRRDGETGVELAVIDTGTGIPGGGDRARLRALLPPLRDPQAGGLRPRPGDRPADGRRDGRRDRRQLGRGARAAPSGSASRSPSRARPRWHEANRR